MVSNFPIVGGTLACDCPYSGEICVLMITNALYVLSMDHNLIPPFIMISGDIIIDDVPKIHCEDPAVEDNCILFDQSDQRTPLQLNDVISYFHARVPTEMET